MSDGDGPFYRGAVYPNNMRYSTPSDTWEQGAAVCMNVPVYRKWYEFWKPKIVRYEYRTFKLVSEESSTITIPSPLTFPHTDR